MNEIESNILAESILETDEVINIVVIEDDDGQIEIYKDAIEENNREKESIKIIANYLKNEDELNSIISEKRIDALIVDLNLGPGDVNNSGNDIIEKVYMYKRIPIFVLSGNLNRLRERREVTSVYKQYNRSDVSFYEIIEEIKKVFLTGYTRIFGHPGKIDKLLNEVFWKYAATNIETWYSENNDEIRDKRFMRFITARMNEQLHYNGNEHDRYNSIEFYICPPNSDKFFNGDIVLLDEKFYLVMTPACEIENKKCEKVMLCEIDFQNFADLKNKIRTFCSNTKKSQLSDLINNKKQDIHFLPPTSFFPGGMVMFNSMIEYDIGVFEERKTLKYRISHVFMKDIINRFSLFLRRNEDADLNRKADYYSKQGQPEIDIDEVIRIINKEESK